MSPQLAKARADLAALITRRTVFTLSIFATGDEKAAMAPRTLGWKAWKDGSVGLTKTRTEQGCAERTMHDVR